MLLNVAKLPEGNSEFQLEDRPNYFELSGEDFQLVQPVTFDCHVWKSGREVIVRGSIHSAFRLTCSRCLEPFTFAVTTTVFADYRPMSQQVVEEVRELEAAELDTRTYAHEEIDLRLLVRDNLSLELPMKPLCREDCAGICPHCGVNLNAQRCSCIERQVDPRLAILRQVKLRTSK